MTADTATDRTDLDVPALRQALLNHREEVLEAEAHTAEDRQAVEVDQTRIGRLSRMDALQQQALAQGLEQRRLVEIQRIDAALHRMEEGEYGYCTACGEPIAAARLRLDPTAPMCITCARANDHHHGHH